MKEQTDEILEIIAEALKVYKRSYGLKTTQISEVFLVNLPPTDFRYIEGA